MNARGAQMDGCPGGSCRNNRCAVGAVEADRITLVHFKRDLIDGSNAFEVLNNWPT